MRLEERVEIPQLSRKNQSAPLCEDGSAGADYMERAAGLDHS
jgi:hypothetical protein